LLLESNGDKPRPPENATNDTNDIRNTADIDDFVEGDRASLLAMHDRFVARLHRAPDDFDASHGLRLAIAALQRLPDIEPVISASS